MEHKNCWKHQSAMLFSLFVGDSALAVNLGTVLSLSSAYPQRFTKHPNQFRWFGPTLAMCSSIEGSTTDDLHSQAHMCDYMVVINLTIYFGLRYIKGANARQMGSNLCLSFIQFPCFLSQGDQGDIPCSPRGGFVWICWIESPGSNILPMWRSHAPTEIPWPV